MMSVMEPCWFSSLGWNGFVRVLIASVTYVIIDMEIWTSRLVVGNRLIVEMSLVMKRVWVSIEFFGFVYYLE